MQQLGHEGGDERIGGNDGGHEQNDAQQRYGNTGDIALGALIEDLRLSRHRGRLFGSTLLRRACGFRFASGLFR